MRTQLLKSAQNAIKRCKYASQSPSPTRAFSTISNPDRKVTILGADSGVGQPLATLLKLNPLISTLSLYDLESTLGVAADISHFATRTKVVGYDTNEDVGKALEGSDLVIISTGVPEKPGLRKGATFSINADAVYNLCLAISMYCPNALVNMITNPVNSTVPIAAEVFKNAGTYDPKRLFGVTTLDVFRAKVIYSELVNLNPEDVNVPVVGGHTLLAGEFSYGHADTTVLPLFSQVEPRACLFADDFGDFYDLNRKTQNAESEVVRLKAGKGSPTLSMAVAGASFADACLKGLNGVPDVVEYAYVQSDITELPFFASKVNLGKNGVEEIMGLGSLSVFEKKNYEKLIPKLKSAIEKGIQYVNDKHKCCENPPPYII